MTSIRPLSPELQERARKELNEDPNRIAEDIQHIKTWLQKQPHLNARTDDQWILNFLRGCKFSLERTKSKFDMYYTMRTLAPEFYGNRDPLQPDIQEFLKLGLFIPLPDLTADGRRVFIQRSAMFDPNKYSADFVFKFNNIFLDILLNEDDAFNISGHYAVIDMQHVKLAHLKLVDLSILRKIGVVAEKGFPLKPKGMYFLNAPSFFETVYKMIMTVYPEKLKSRIRLIPKDEPDEIYRYIPREIMPPEYGGEGKTLEELTVHWKKRVEDYRDWFLEDAQFGANEKKRRGKPKTSEELFGLEGSFRKLNVD